MRRIHSIPRLAAAAQLAVAMLFAVAPASLGAQEVVTKQYFTLTDGNVWWWEGPDDSDTAHHRTSIAYDKGNRWAEVHPFWSTPLFYDYQIGHNYLALDTTGTTPGIVNLSAFTPLCLWQRTGTTGYYFQEYAGVRYYLVGSSNRGLHVVKVATGQAMEESSYWYNWDFGAAVTETSIRDGRQVESYYWMMLRGGSWSTMSCNSYYRPETIWYDSLNVADTSLTRHYYCSDVDPSTQKVVPAGHGALYLTVTAVEHPIEAHSAEGSVGLVDVAGIREGDTLRYGEADLTVSPSLLLPVGGTAIQVQVQQPYVEYRRELARHGMSTNWRERTGGRDRFGYDGVPTFDTLYYSADGSLLVPFGTTYTPASAPVTITPTDTTYTLDHHSRRYLTLSRQPDGSALLHLRAMPATDLVATLTIRIDYSLSGISQDTTLSFVITGRAEQSPKEPAFGPVVRGAVFGGGRMADVTANTAVTVHRCDSISFVYGGNDIAGTVAGGSTVTLGTLHTTADTAVHVGSVYGGGNGYYDYQGIPSVSASTTAFSGTVWQFGLRDSAAAVVDSNLSSNVPAIATTHVVMANDYVLVDSLFGGARNAHITGVAGATVDLLGGTALAVFGGNNVGGAFTASDAAVAVNVEGTSLPADPAVDTNIENSFYGGFGRQFGVRHLFGGGNRVEAPNVAVSITGGMVDTCFAGGNSASVLSAALTMNATTGKVFHNATTRSSDTSWVGTKGSYNVRCLFGGNNHAPMAIVPVLTLTSGGVGTVYGGGNAGDMTASEALASADSALFSDLSHNMSAPAAIGTRVKIASSGDSMQVDYLYGGCRMANVTNSTLVVLKGGEVGSVFGGCNVGGDVGTAGAQLHGSSGNYGTYVVIDSGATVLTNAFAGANGYYHCNTESGWGRVYVGDGGLQLTDNAGDPFDPYDLYDALYIPTHNATHLLMRGGLVKGNLYGGANLADVGFKGSRYLTNSSTDTLACTENAGEVHLTMAGGRVNGSVYGGSNMAIINGLAYLKVCDTSRIDGSFFCGNDRVGEEPTTFTAYTAPTVATNGEPLNNSDASQALYSAYVLIEGQPTITRVYGGGNGAYNYGGEYSRPEYGKVLDYCSVGGDPRPFQRSSFIDLHVSGGSIDTVFGGGNGVTVTSSATVLLNATDTASTYVHTIFGGNNRDNMACVPKVTLKSGRVEKVYGGSNAGDMTDFQTIASSCSGSVDGVSAYVLVNSTEVSVDSAIFGGCNKASLSGRAYVDIHQTSARGVNYVYGGNDISGKVYGNTRVDVSGGVVHHLYGGSNGRYDYYELSDSIFAVYPWGTAVADTAGRLLSVNVKPDVDSANVNIFGGKVLSHLYGGGRMADCRATYVKVDDQGSCGTKANLQGEIYGGGEGNWTSLLSERRGNVTEATYVHLIHADTVLASGAKAYGGGRGGDVMNTHITTFDTWERPFAEIYGGCWGSDVYGTAYMTLNGALTSDSAQNALAVFGGNDFTGNVYKSELTINSGRYGAIYGAGNGLYDAAVYTGHDYAHSVLYAPNNEYVHVTVAPGNAIVDSNLYGGGRMGTTFTYQKDALRDYILTDVASDGILRKTADTSRIIPDVLDYASIIVDVLGGDFRSNIFAGAAGRDQQLVYGLKMLNMQEGSVYGSIYGGSQRVSDGYPFECVDLGNTTYRPSSIVNVTGGTIGVNVYGGGYMGSIHGSAFVNVGDSAVQQSAVWRDRYEAYDIFRPGNGRVAALGKAHIDITGSVYAGADWGDNLASADFNKRGFYGGESRIMVNGMGYKVAPTSDPLAKNMDIGNSLIGSGTSVLGGDSLSRIDVLNYGGVSDDCHASKKLRSIQRADVLWLRNTAIRYEGGTDAVSANPSIQYTINRVGTVNVRGYNVIDLDAVMTEIDRLNFYRDNDTSASINYAGKCYENRERHLVEAGRQNLWTDNAAQCGNDVSMCTKLSMIDPVTRKYAALVVNNGVNVDILSEANGYGSVSGFAYLLAEEGTNAVVTAHSKYGTVHPNDGGFMSTCKDENKSISVSSSSSSALIWDSCTANCSTSSEYEYNNYGDVYRVWSVGQGKRTRFAVILAHSNPALLPEDTSFVLSYSGGSSRLAIAHSVLTLPPTSPGHYYKISSIQIEDDNHALSLTDSAWYAKDTNNLAVGEWNVVGDPDNFDASMFKGVRNILDNPASTFGLLMASGNNFKTDAAGNYVKPGVVAQADWDYNKGATPITGNTYANTRYEYFTTAVVSDDQYASPQMDLYLTYDTAFANTMLAAVYFSLTEYDSLGNELPNPIDVSITIATLLENFRDMEYNVLAMYNEGRTNYYDRKAVLPALLRPTSLYLESVEWFPTNDTVTPYRFYLTGSEPTVIGTSDPNTFCLGIQPMDNISSSLTSTVGWSHKAIGDNRDLYSLVRSDAASRERYSGGGSSAQELTVPPSPKGLYIGELDGRGLAALNLQLTFDGNKIYPNDTVGDVLLHLRNYIPESATDTGNAFILTVHIRCRESGDTIYVASADTVSRCSIVIPHATLASEPSGGDVGKHPGQYLRTFEEASEIFEEGDVVAILDTVKIAGTMPVSINSMPIIRYSGHHHDLPGECGTYRGTMIQVAGTGRFSASDLSFNGSSVSRITPGTGEDVVPRNYGEYYEYTNSGLKIDPIRKLDTTMAMGPIIEVVNGGQVSLANILMENNYNGATDTHLGGAIGVTGGGKLTLTNNIDIRNCIVPKSGEETASHPVNGAIYVDSGAVTLRGESSSAITITDNFAMAGPKFYKEFKVWDESRSDSVTVRYVFDTSAFHGDALYRNLFLTRTAANATDDFVSDAKTDVVTLSSITPATRIGISKWFPGEQVRDTIRIVKSEALSALEKAYANGNFLSDEGYHVWFSEQVNDQFFYLHRCATFRHQLATAALPLEGAGNGRDVLAYEPELATPCPTGGDRIIYRVQGGFMPYIYSWTNFEGEASQTDTTRYDSRTIQAQLAALDTSGYRQSLADTLFTRPVSMTHTDSVAFRTYSVQADDASGFCHLKKNIAVRITKRDEASFAVLKDTSDWRDTNNAFVDAHVTDTAHVLRNYQAIRITPYVWVDRTNGTIAARVINSSAGIADANIYMDEADTTTLGDLLFCPGEVITLSTTPKESSKSFIMWDFDPYYERTVPYVVPPQSSAVVAYYGPDDYWKDVVSSESLAGAHYDGNYYYNERPSGKGYVTTYHGDVHIYDENGLAWLISTVNGLNGTQIRPFFWNNVYIHEKTDGTAYDMRDHKWTPVGTTQHRFRGKLVGVGSGDTATVALASPVVIKNIILNEPDMDYVGFFGWLDSAEVGTIELEGVLARGAQYVGALAGRSAHTVIHKTNVKDSADASAITTILSTHYVSGGLVGESSNDSISYADVAAKFVGDAVYSGGLIGSGYADTVSNSAVRNDNRMNGVYVGGVMGQARGSNNNNPLPAGRGLLRLFRTKAPSEPTVVRNNYVHITTDQRTMRVGGIAGHAEHSIIENNYVYGGIDGKQANGGVVAESGNASDVNHNYYAAKTAGRAVDVVAGTSSIMADNTSFSGSGNAVTLTDLTYGVNNLTRVLNIWVRQQNAAGDNYRTWRSDLEGTNSGYPVFGQPDLIPVADSMTVEGCEELEWNGTLYTEDTRVDIRVVDSTQMIDSTLSTLIRIHHGSLTSLVDTATLGEDYEGHGFRLSAAEAALLLRTLDSTGSATVVLSDTLQTAFGCDSVVSLALTFTAATGVEPVAVEQVQRITVYPNPTEDRVTVQASGMTRVELYDNEGRTLERHATHEQPSATLSLGRYPSGIYYLRVHTPQGVTIQKVIKR